MIYRAEAMKLFKLSVFLLSLLLPIVIFGQYKGDPVKKENLIQVLHSKQFQSSEIAKIINDNGVNFRLTPEIESELVSAGARPLVVNAVRNNYRGAIAANPPKPINNSVNRTGNKTPANSVAVSNNSINTSLSNTSKAYDGMINRAIELYDSQKDRHGAIIVLQKAVTIQPSNPRAYQLLGFMYLYGLSDFTQSENYMNGSLSRGGSAVFRVHHDHDGVFRSTCSGSLYISKNNVRFESDDNKHTFDTPDSNIKEVKLNGSWRRLIQIKRGSYKIVLRNKDDDDGKKFSFAPLTGSDKESKMVIRLIGKNN